MHIFVFYSIVATISSVTLLKVMTAGDETLIFLWLLLELFVLMVLDMLFGKQVIKTMDRKERRSSKLVSREGRILTYNGNKLSFSCMNKKNQIKTMTIDMNDLNTNVIIIHDPFNYVVERKIFERRCSEWLFLRGFYYQTVIYEYEIHVSGQDDLPAG